MSSMLSLTVRVKKINDDDCYSMSFNIFLSSLHKFFLLVSHSHEYIHKILILFLKNVEFIIHKEIINKCPSFENAKT